MLGLHVQNVKWGLQGPDLSSHAAFSKPAGGE